MKIKSLAHLLLAGSVFIVLLSACGATPTPPPPPPPEAVATRTPTAAPAPEMPLVGLPNPGAVRIEFQPNAATAAVQGQIAANNADHWVLGAMAGQNLSVQLSLSAGQAILVIWGADGTVLISDHAGATVWHGPIPITEDYFIDVRAVGNDMVSYTLQVTIPPAPNPQPSVQRVRFQTGQVTADVQGQLAPGGVDRWALDIMAGQTLFAQLAQPLGQSILVIWGADGVMLVSDHAGATSWSGPVPKRQDYYIDVRNVSASQASYTLRITIPPLSPPTPVPQPAATRIQFGAGQISALQKGQLAPGASAHYVLRVMAGQVMSVNVWPDGVSAGQPVLFIWGADGNVLISDHAGAESWSGPVPSNQDYYIGVRNDGAGTAAYVLQITIPPR